MRSLQIQLEQFLDRMEILRHRRVIAIAFPQRLHGIMQELVHDPPGQFFNCCLSWADIAGKLADNPC